MLCLYYPKSVDSDQPPRFLAADLGLYCLLVPFYWMLGFVVVELWFTA